MTLRNCKGFSLVFLLTLPTLMALLALIYHVVYLIEFKSEFRFKCINESLTLQKGIITSTADTIAKTNGLLETLKSISTPIKYSVLLADYPKFDTQTNAEPTTSLVYELNYTWIEKFYLKCGVIKTIKDNEWHYEIIYSTNSVTSSVTGAGKY